MLKALVFLVDGSSTVKGVVFTEFTELVEDKFGVVVADAVLRESANGGAYTSVGDYDHRELVQMVGRLSSIVNHSVPALLEAFGVFLFGRFAVLYPQFFVGQDDALTFLEHIEDRIHSEVRKLYPTADLPRFECVRQGCSLTMVYESPRCFSPLARGLIAGCLEHFGSFAEVDETDLSQGRGAKVRFEIREHG